MKCANNDAIQLSARLDNDVLGRGRQYNWYFIVNTCDNLKSVTKRSTCKTPAESAALVNDITISTKVSTQFFSAKTYINNGYRKNSVFS